MDVTIRLVVAAALLMIIFGVIMLVFTGKAGDFGEFANEQADESTCQLWKTNYQNQYCRTDKDCTDCELANKLRDKCEEDRFRPEC